MRARLILAVAGALTVSIPAPVPAQQVAFAATALSELDSATKAAVVREMGRAQSRGLPLQPLVAKVREGQIKRAAPNRIRIAVAALAARLDSARAALGEGSNAAELVAGADALSAGVDQGSLRAIRTAGGPRDLAAPLGALAQLVASGVPVKRATGMVVELLQRNAGANEMLAFGVAVEGDVSAGVPAEESALFRLRAMEAEGLGSERLTVTAPNGDPLTQVPSAASGGGGGAVSRPKRRP
jgi:hypothetical protein